ncbi:hypothetical protein LENED_008924 [Lentinula edodes]|uniref:Uncharacterized protein n=1 Tax=Lentinula edodes TaxID=5353 RepID=A0A1Q3EIE2_LENED|nr:hypothetical protein LENED_008924 [Lentinula edodes]
MTDDSNTAGLYSPSDDSEGPVLRDFVNETLAHERDHPEDSPRSELLSPIHGAATSHDSPAAVDHHQDSRSRRGPSQRYRRERESAYRGLDQREVLRLLIEHEYEASKMRKTLYMVFSKLEAEIQRSAEAESQAQAYIKRFKELNAEKLNVERESHTLEAELTLYKIQYDLAQKEIVKTRDTVLALQTQLDAAENDARRARGDARKVKEALEIWKAREEGRRQGFEAGWNRAREEFGALNAQTVLEYGNEYSDNLPPPELSSFQRTDAQGSGDGGDSISYRTYPPPDQRGLLQFPEVPMVPASIFNDPPPQSLPIAESISRHSSVSERPQQAIPTHVSSRPSSTRPDMATPAVQMYSLPIPPANEVEFHNRPQSSIRRTNSKQPQPQLQPWLAETPITRASSPRPPDNFIPAASEDGHIALPPPHELAEYPPSPQPTVNTLPGNTAYSSHGGASMEEGPRREYTSSKGKARATDSWYNHRGEVDSRAHTPDIAVAKGVLQPEASTSWYQDRPRRASMSSRYSANSSGGLLDAWGYPIQTETKRSGGLGNTLKNIFKGKGKDARMLSMIKENPLRGTLIKELLQLVPTKGSRKISDMIILIRRRGSVLDHLRIHRPLKIAHRVMFEYQHILLFHLCLQPSNEEGMGGQSPSDLLIQGSTKVHTLHRQTRADLALMDRVHSKQLVVVQIALPKGPQCLAIILILLVHPFRYLFSLHRNPLQMHPMVCIARLGVDLVPQSYHISAQTNILRHGLIVFVPVLRH